MYQYVVFLDDQDPGLFKYSTDLKTKERREREREHVLKFQQFIFRFLDDGEPLGGSHLEILVDSPAVN